MPIYKFEHVIPLSRSQKTGLAQAITDWHATTFKAPRFIVNVRFIDVSQGVLADSYIGGAQRQTNRLFVSLRSGTGRTESQLQGISDKLESLWDSAVGKSCSNQLRGVFILGHIDSAKEAGFHLPLVSFDLDWESNCARYLVAFITAWRIQAMGQG
jgi:phenylpyruvate tautomerase PptA (4-oxalocrotonate tautomerase family)